MKLVFVYNARSGMMAAIADTIHKAVSPETYPCNLCRITYSASGTEAGWKDFIASLPYASEFLHKDEFVSQYPNLKNTHFPAVFMEDQSDMRVIISASEINEARDVAGLEELVKRALPLERKETITYRCPECGLRYRDKETAARCGAWCQRHKSCNLDIIKNAISE